MQCVECCVKEGYILSWLGVTGMPCNGMKRRATDGHARTQRRFDSIFPFSALPLVLGLRIDDACCSIGMNSYASPIAHRVPFQPLTPREERDRDWRTTTFSRP